MSWADFNALLERFPSQLLGSLVPVPRDVVPWATFAKSRMRESHTYGSERAKAEWLSYSTGIPSNCVFCQYLL